MQKKPSKSPFYGLIKQCHMYLFHCKIYASPSSHKFCFGSPILLEFRLIVEISTLHASMDWINIEKLSWIFGKYWVDCNQTRCVWWIRSIWMSIIFALSVGFRNFLISYDFFIFFAMELQWRISVFLNVELEFFSPRFRNRVLVDGMTYPMS